MSGRATFRTPTDGSQCLCARAQQRRCSRVRVRERTGTLRVGLSCTKMCMRSRCIPRRAFSSIEASFQSPAAAPSYGRALCLESIYTRYSLYAGLVQRERERTSHWPPDTMSTSELRGPADGVPDILFVWTSELRREAEHAVSVSMVRRLDLQASPAQHASPRFIVRVRADETCASRGRGTSRGLEEDSR